MEDLGDNISSTRFKPLFIQEDEEDPDRTAMEQGERDTAQTGLTFTGAQLNKFGLIKPYLQEMDSLLKSCEELTSIPFSSHFSSSHDEMSLAESAARHCKKEDATESYEEKSVSQQYLFTSYIDTHMDGPGTEDKTGQAQTQVLAAVSNRCRESADISRQREMPLTSVGHKLSDTMVEYEGQLSGMLAMLESCMEDAGMDFEPPSWTTDASQEYVHISKNPHLCGDTTLVSIQQEKPKTSETQLMQSESWESWAGQLTGTVNVSRESRNEVTVGSATNGRQQNPMISWNNMVVSKQQLEKRENLNTNEGGHGPQSRFSDPSMIFNNDPMRCEVQKTEHISSNEDAYIKRDINGMQEDDAEGAAVKEEVLEMDTSDVGSGLRDLGALGSQMDECIEEVQRLEERRKELLAEVLELRGNKEGEKTEESHEEDTEESIDRQVMELMNALKREEEERRQERKREIRGLREERAEEEKRLWKVNLERQGLQEELRRLKRRLFAMARDCAHNQFVLNHQHHQVELLKREEEELHSLVLQLTEQVSQLSTAHKQQMSDLQAKLHAMRSSQTSDTHDEMTECKRHSCGDIQQYLQGGLRALEDRYEPILLALLKRREVTAGALVKVKEQAQELRAQLRPLKEEIQALMLQRVRLEEKLRLIQLQRTEDVEQYKQTVYRLEERTREMKTELRLQKRKTKEMEELKEGLSKKLLLYRAAIEDHNKCDDAEKTER